MGDLASIAALCSEVTIIIGVAKAAIRAKYPDSTGGE